MFYSGDSRERFVDCTEVLITSGDGTPISAAPSSPVTTMSPDTTSPTPKRHDLYRHRHQFQVMVVVLMITRFVPDGVMKVKISVKLTVPVST
jgi:hypothetical protein